MAATAAAGAVMGLRGALPAGVVSAQKISAVPSSKAPTVPRRRQSSSQHSRCRPLVVAMAGQQQPGRQKETPAASGPVLSDQARQAEAASTSSSSEPQASSSSSAATDDAALDDLGKQIAQMRAARRDAQGAGSPAASGGYLAGVAAEAKEVTWPTVSQVIGATGLTVAICGVSCIAMWSVNFGLATLANAVFTHAQ
eukprot:jgi/Chlat1/1890/Chrsp145S00772